MPGVSRPALDSCLKRIAALDPELQAFQLVLADEARQAARRCAQERDQQLPAGELHGVAIAVKDNIDMAGQPTTGGSRLYGDPPATTDAAVVRQLRAAGMIILGKTRMQDLAFGGWGTNRVSGTPRNPYDARVHRVPGGSSSGSAVAVAARLVPMALGTDTGGSVRIPAAVCGIVGLKTTMGQISREGILPLSHSLDTVGPMTTSVGDAALLYEVLAGRQAGRDGSQRRGVSGAEAGAQMRIGVLAEHDLVDCHPDVLAALHKAMCVFRERGAEFREVALGTSFDSLVEKNGILIASEGWQAHGARIAAHPEWMDPAGLKRFLRGRDIPAQDYAAALQDRLQAQAQVPAIFDGVDALLTPTVPMPAIPVAEVDEDVLPFNRYTRAVNYLNLCALTVPAGLSGGGLPLGMQLIGLPHTERRLLFLGQVLEDGFGRLPPPVLAMPGLVS